MFADDLAPHLKTELAKCPDADKDIARLNVWIGTFSKFSDFVAIVTENMVTHMNDVVADHMTMKSYIKSDDWEEAGQAYASILVRLLGDIPRYA